MRIVIAIAVLCAAAFAAAYGCESGHEASSSGLVDVAHGLDGGMPGADGGGVREPDVVRGPDAGAVLTPIEPKPVIEIAAGTGDDQVAVIPSAGEDLPRGPESFDIDPDGNVYILDSQGGAVKVFGTQGALARRIDLAGQGSAFVDCAVSKTGELALAHAPENLVHVLPKGAAGLGQAARQIALPAVAGFDGVSYNGEGTLFARTAGEMTYAIDGSQSNPFLALLSMKAAMFVRVRRVSPALGVVYASAVYDADGWQGNAQKVFEIAPKMSIGSISFIDADAKGRAYLHIEAVDESPAGSIDVKRYVMRVGAAPADWTAPFEIPTDTYSLPFRDLRVGADGTVYAMLVYQDKVKVIRWNAE